MIRLSAFADEISPDLDEQIAVLTDEGIRAIELRGVWDTNVLDLTDDRVAAIRRRLDAAGITISAIGSPVGKAPADIPLDAELARLDRAIELAQAFDTGRIRMFSFYPSRVAEGQDAFREKVMERLQAMTARAAERGITLLLENETDLYGDIPERCVDILRTLDAPNIVAAFDPANFIVSKATPFPDGYEALRPWIGHVHVKDARADGTIVPAGEGVARWSDLLEALRRDGYDGYFSLEPHLTAAGRFKGFSGPDQFRRAAGALKGLLVAMGWEYA